MCYINLEQGSGETETRTLFYSVRFCQINITQIDLVIFDMMRESLKNITVYSLSLFYIGVGIKHFTDMDFFLVIVPPYIPYPELMVYISGLFEIVLGILLVPRKTRKYGALGLLVLLIAVFPANIYLFTSEIVQNTFGISRQDALIRLPFQVPLILFAYWHSKIESPKSFDVLCFVLFVPTIIYFMTLG